MDEGIDATFVGCGETNKFRLSLRDRLAGIVKEFCLNERRPLETSTANPSTGDKEPRNDSPPGVRGRKSCDGDSGSYEIHFRSGVVRLRSFSFVSDVVAHTAADRVETIVLAFRHTRQPELRGHSHQICKRVGLHFLHRLCAVILYCVLMDAEFSAHLFI